MDEIDVYEKMSAIAETPQFSMIFGTENEQSRLIAEHILLLSSAAPFIAFNCSLVATRQ